MGFLRCAVEYLPDPARRSFSNRIWELVPREEPALHDLAVWRRYGRAHPVPDDENRDVVAWKRGKISEEPMELRLPLHDDASFFKNLPDHRGFGGFTPFDATAREMPSRFVAVADKKHAAVLA